MYLASCMVGGSDKLACMQQEGHFKGDELDDVNDFIKSFNRFADFYNWSSEKRMRAMPPHFQGHANIWFNSLAEGAYAIMINCRNSYRINFSS